MSSTIETIRICQECSNKFTARTTVTRFCSLKCNRKNYKKRARKIKVEKSEKKTIEKKQLPPREVATKSYLSIKDACSLLTISRTTLWRLIGDRKIKSVKLGRRIVISRISIDKLFI